MPRGGASELEFCVGDDDALRSPRGLRLPCRYEALIAKFLGVFVADQLHHLFEKGMFSSCPVAALVAGVKIGSGSLSDSFNPAGSLMPQTAPLCLYSFQAEPET